MHDPRKSTSPTPSRLLQLLDSITWNRSLRQHAPRKTAERAATSAATWNWWEKRNCIQKFCNGRNKLQCQRRLSETILFDRLYIISY